MQFTPPNMEKGAIIPNEFQKCCGLTYSKYSLRQAYNFNFTVSFWFSSNLGKT